MPAVVLPAPRPYPQGVIVSSWSPFLTQRLGGKPKEGNHEPEGKDDSRFKLNTKEI
jgi:hypothetical protein